MTAPRQWEAVAAELDLDWTRRTTDARSIGRVQEKQRAWWLERMEMSL